MGSVLASRSQDRHDLAAGASADVLADLIKQRGRVHVRSEAAAGRAEWEGVIAGATDEHLLFELATSDASECAIQGSTPLRIVFEVGRACYTFSAPCVAVESGEESTVVRVKRPISVTKVERRRSPRRGLREPVRVRIRADSGRRPLDEWAALLNLSADGLACSVPSDAACMVVDDVLHISFELDCPDARFDLPSRVINVTRGASVDKTILGLEFVSDDMFEMDRHRLVVALAATGPS